MGLAGPDGRAAPEPSDGIHVTLKLHLRTGQCLLLDTNPHLRLLLMPRPLHLRRHHRRLCQEGPHAAYQGRPQRDNAPVSTCLFYLYPCMYLCACACRATTPARHADTSHECVHVCVCLFRHARVCMSSVTLVSVFIYLSSLPLCPSAVRGVSALPHVCASFIRHLHVGGKGKTISYP